MGGDLSGASPTIVRQNILNEVAIAVPVPGAPVSPAGLPMVPPLHTEPKSADAIRKEYQELVDLADKLPKGPLRTAHIKLMETIKPVYDRAASNAELRENLSAEGRELAAEIFGNVRAEAIELVNKLFANASQGANGLMQWINDQVGKIEKLATIVENHLPEMDGRPSAVPGGVVADPPSTNPPPLVPPEVEGMDGKPIPQPVEDLTMRTTGGVPEVKRQASEFVDEINSKPTLKFLLDFVETTPEMHRPVSNINFNRKTRDRLNDFLTDTNKTEAQKHAELQKVQIFLPPYIGASRIGHLLVNHAENNIPATATIADVIKGGMVVDYTVAMKSAGSPIDLSVLNLSGMYLPGNISLRGANLTGADLSFAKMPDVDLTNTQIAQADFAYTQMPGADLTLTLGHGADFLHANLTMASFRMAEIPGARFSNANITLARFNEANITRTDWRLLQPDDPLPPYAGSDFTGVTGGNTILRNAAYPNYPF